ncbi:hypothetical protein [Pedobacter jeongneungensis]
MNNYSRFKMSVPGFIKGVKRNNLFLIFTAFHFFVIFMVCFKSLVHTINTTLITKNRDDKTKVENIIGSVLSTTAINFYGTYSGTINPYGYFAPNVASSYIIEFSCFNEKNKLVSKFILPPFKRVESVNRYSALLGNFQEILRDLDNHKPKKKDEIGLKYLNVVIKAMSKGLVNKNKGTYKVKSILFLYDQPTIDSFRIKNNAKLILLKSYEAS